MSLPYPSAPAQSESRSVLAIPAFRKLWRAMAFSSTRGVFGGGNGPQNTIDYITIATTGNATDFGDLTIARYSLGACSSSTRGVFGGGNTGSTSNVIDYVTIASAGNATDFGDLTVARYGCGGCGSSTRGIYFHMKSEH